MPQEERPAQQGESMPNYEVSVAYVQLDIEDLDRMELIASVAPGAVFVASEGRTKVSDVVSANSAVEAVERLAETIRSVDSTSEPIRVEFSLMAISDIAELLGLNRETVRLWSIGKRGPGNFPAAVDSVGDRVRVWAASDVYQWLTENSVPCPDIRPLSMVEVTDATKALQRLRKRWLDQPALCAVPEWTKARHEEITVPVTHGAQDAAGL
ncbi:helix-turn-helix transcriptional regulator [Kribbella steppae]|nr:hypothetical protein [Kribbella steppae]